MKREENGERCEQTGGGSKSPMEEPGHGEKSSGGTVKVGMVLSAEAEPERAPGNCVEQKREGEQSREAQKRIGDYQ